LQLTKNLLTPNFGKKYEIKDKNQDKIMSDFDIKVQRNGLNKIDDSDKLSCKSVDDSFKKGNKDFCLMK
jgi:hypothetical protein